MDDWKVTGKSVEDLWKWYTKSGYGDADDFEDMDDFIKTHIKNHYEPKGVWLEMTEGTKEEYQKFFQAALKKFGAKRPADMDDEKKKKFFDYIDKNWTKEEQQEFSEGELPPALKKAIAYKKAKKNGDKEEDEAAAPVGKKQEVKAVATVDYTFSDNKGAKAANAFARLWVPKARRGDDWDEDEFETEIFGSKKNQLTVDSGMDGDMEKLHKAILGRYAKQLTDHEVVSESIDMLRKIVDSKQHGRVGPVKVDIHSANAMVKVFDQLSDANKQKVEQMLKTKKAVNTFAEFAISNLKK